MRAPASDKRKTVYTEAMEVFHAAADLIGLDHRIRLELEEPDYEHIFYLTAQLNDRLVPVSPNGKNAALPESDIPDEYVVPLYDGKYILRPGALRRGTLHIDGGVIRLGDKGLFKIEKGAPKRFKAYRVQHNQ